jgi:membrane protease YdiL (CAAX protease family)
VFASIQAFVIALVLERDFSRWKLAGAITLASVLFTVSHTAAIFLGFHHHLGSTTTISSQ